MVICGGFGMLMLFLLALPRVRRTIFLLGLVQHSLDTVEEEGVLLDAIGLQVFLEPIKKVGIYLKGHSPLISDCHWFTLHFIKVGNKVGHVLAERLPGVLLPLPDFGVQGLWDLGTEILGFLCCYGWHLLCLICKPSISVKQ